MEVIVTALARPPKGIFMMRLQELFKPGFCHLFRLVCEEAGLYDTRWKFFQKMVEVLLQSARRPTWRRLRRRRVGVRRGLCRTSTYLRQLLLAVGRLGVRIFTSLQMKVTTGQQKNQAATRPPQPTT